jgi:putative endonuclease
MKYWVYIIYSESTDSYYKGQTSNLSDRLVRHNNGWEKSTNPGAPWMLIWSAEKPDRSSAVMLERKLKNLSRERLLKFISKNK